MAGKGAHVERRLPGAAASGRSRPLAVIRDRQLCGSCVHRCWSAGPRSGCQLHLHESRCPRWRPGLQPQVRKDFLDHGRLQDRRMILRSPQRFELRARRSQGQIDQASPTNADWLAAPAVAQLPRRTAIHHAATDLTAVRARRRAALPHTISSPHAAVDIAATSRSRSTPMVNPKQR